MASITHVSEAVSIGLHTMVLLAKTVKDRLVAREIAETLNISEHHLQKIHQRLKRAGLLRSVRGPGGGVALARDPGAISLLDIFEAIEGKFVPRTCMFAYPVCGKDKCIMRGLLTRLDEEARDYFRATTLDQFVTPAPVKPAPASDKTS